MMLQVKRLVKHARLPVRGSELAAGYDLAASESGSVPAGGNALVPTGLVIKCPPGTYGRIAPRSGLAIKNMIGVGAGVVDADYRGEVCIVLFNHGPEPFAFEVGDRVAQLVLERIYTPRVEEVDDLDATQRGAGGFGSTNKQTINNK
jgi:dUTP pyrophosphatase